MALRRGVNPSNDGLLGVYVHYMFSRPRSRSNLQNRAFHGRPNRHHRENQSGERRPLRRGVSLWRHPSSRRPLFDLEEPEEAVPEWKRWSPILLRPEGLYGTRPTDGGNKASKLKAIREALRTAKRAGSPPIAIVRVSSSVRKSSSITNTAARSCGCCSRRGFADHSRRLRSGEAKLRIFPPLRRRRGAPAGRPDLQPLPHPHCDGDPRAGCTRGDWGWPGEDADVGDRM